MNENNPHHSETFSAEPVLGFTRIYNIEDFVRCDSDVIHASEFHWSLWEWLFILVTCGRISFPRLSMNFIATNISLVYGRYLWVKPRSKFWSVYVATSGEALCKSKGLHFEMILSFTFFYIFNANINIFTSHLSSSKLPNWCSSIPVVLFVYSESFPRMYSH